jgi:hypothetical protein
VPWGLGSRVGSRSGRLPGGARPAQGTRPPRAACVGFLGACRKRSGRCGRWARRGMGLPECPSSAEPSGACIVLVPSACSGEPRATCTCQPVPAGGGDPCPGIRGGSAASTFVYYYFIRFRLHYSLTFESKSSSGINFDH